MAGILNMLLASGFVGVIQDLSSPSDGSYDLNNDGTYALTGVPEGNWVEPASAVVAAQWEVMVEVTSGNITDGTTDTWLSLGASRTWEKTNPGTAVLTFSFRDAASQTIWKVQTDVTITVA